ncbi:hypothetical protein, partial [Streptococcus pneumoniae]|uniref:hypothetical protein n=1 Tax=Streptococcus pneumoniae TaxID=1313 RepID=UPI001E65E13A
MINEDTSDKQGSEEERSWQVRAGDGDCRLAGRQEREIRVVQEREVRNLWKMCYAQVCSTA